MPRMRERWLVTGASGQLGGHVVRQLATEGLADRVLALAGRGNVGTADVNAQHIDVRDEAALRACVAAYRPTIILHLAAMTAVAEAYARPTEAERVNTHATGVLVDAAERCGARLVFSSTDMVFDGEAAPYREDDPPNPLNQYGRTKAAAERLVLIGGNTLVVRLPLMYGLPVTPRATTCAQQLAALERREPLRLFVDEFRTPASLRDGARAVIGLARSERPGLLHVAGPQRLSRYQLAQAFARALRIDNPRLEPVSRSSVASPERRPADLSLDDTAFRHEFQELAPGPISREALTPAST